jgi:hypothetical protein
VSSTDQPALETPPGQELRCPVCLSLHRPGQRYCLECGAPLDDSALPPDPARRGAGLSSQRLALALGVLVLVLGGAGIAWALTRDDGGSRELLLHAPPFSIPLLGTVGGATVPTTGPTTVPTDGATLPPTDTGGTIPTESIQTFTEPPTTADTTPTTGPTTPTDTTGTDTTGTDTTGAGATFPDEWPVGLDAWATILISKEADQFDSAYMENLKREAAAKGLGRLGILYSNNHSTLNPGFRVLYQGPYDIRSDAEAAALNAKQAGYAFAYPRRVAP